MVDFRYYINRQGPRGQQGVKGEQGYSPQVIVGKNTASEFTLKVINEDGSFETENLKAVPEDRGGTYVRYDKDTYQEYIGDPDFASTEKYGVVRLATKEDLETQEESLAVTSAILDTYLQENYLNKVHGDIVIGDVSFRGNTSFTGNNTFDGETTFNGHTWTAEQEAVNLNVTSLATMKNVNVSGTLTSNGEINAVAINATGIKNSQNNKYYLNQASITAGSDNLAITETTDGVQITCYAPTNEQIEALQRLINDLSTKIDNLTNRVRDLETQIDGGIA